MVMGLIFRSRLSAALARFGRFVPAKIQEAVRLLSFVVVCFCAAERS
jgi:hypothetical protein